MAVDIIFETHSISVDNERGIATGWLPGRLSETGRQFARELGERRRSQGVASVFTSDLQRAVETAQIAFGDSGIPIYTDPRLRECNYGALNGMPVAELETQRSRHINEPFPGGESYGQATERVRDFLEELSRDWAGQQVIVIGHAATRFALDHLLNGVPLEDLVAAPFEWQPGWRYALR